MTSNNSIKPLEVTTHNLYFHEEASIFTIDSYQDYIATGGGDNTIRLWRIIMSPNKSDNYKYTTSLNSTIKIEYISDLKGHSKSVNCVRFNKDGILASASDTGKVIIHRNEDYHVVREADNLDCYELVWASDKLIVGLSNGNLEIYEISNFTSKYLVTVNAHTDIIQGIAYNHKYDLIATQSKDKTGKLILYKKKPVILERYGNGEKIFNVGRSFFRRICFSEDGKFLFLCNLNSNSVLVLNYPFRINHWIYKIGPFDSEPVKVMEKDNFLFVITRRSLYVYIDLELSVAIENICFKNATDACIMNDTIFISSLDGFISSFKWKNI